MTIRLQIELKLTRQSKPIFTKMIMRRSLFKIVSVYLDIQSIRLYEGPYDDVSEDDRVYLKAFSVKETRYIYLELTFQNLQKDSV